MSALPKATGISKSASQQLGVSEEMLTEISGLWQILANVMEEIPEDMVNIPLVTGIHRWQVVVCDF